MLRHPGSEGVGRSESRVVAWITGCVRRGEQGLPRGATARAERRGEDQFGDAIWGRIGKWQIFFGATLTGKKSQRGLFDGDEMDDA